MQSAREEEDLGICAHCSHHEDQIRILYDALNSRAIEIIRRILGPQFKFHELPESAVTHDKNSCVNLVLRTCWLPDDRGLVFVLQLSAAHRADLYALLATDCNSGGGTVVST